MRADDMEAMQKVADGRHVDETFADVDCADPGGEQRTRPQRGRGRLAAPQPRAGHHRGDADRQQHHIVRPNQVADTHRRAAYARERPVGVIRLCVREHHEEDRARQPAGLRRVGHDHGREEHVARIGRVEQASEQARPSAEQHRARAGDREKADQRACHRPDAQGDLGLAEEPERDGHREVGADVQAVDVIADVVFADRRPNRIGDVPRRVLDVITVPERRARREPDEEDGEQTDSESSRRDGFI